MIDKVSTTTSEVQTNTTLPAFSNSTDDDRVQSVAAADYFFRTPLLKWFALNMIGIVPIQRELTMTGSHPLEACFTVLEAGQILIIFPERARSNSGATEHMAQLNGDPDKLNPRFELEHKLNPRSNHVKCSAHQTNRVKLSLFRFPTINRDRHG